LDHTNTNDSADGAAAQAQVDLPVLTLGQIRAVDDLPTERIDIPEWGGCVIIRGVSVERGFELLQSMQGDDGQIDNEKATLVAFVHGVVEPHFAEADVNWLKQKSLGAVTRVTRRFIALCGFDDAALTEAQKNS